MSSADRMSIVLPTALREWIITRRICLLRDGVKEKPDAIGTAIAASDLIKKIASFRGDFFYEKYFR